MEPDRWPLVQQLYAAALEKDPGERAAFLKQACGADTTLRTEIESLLAFAAGADAVLQGAVQEAVADIPHARFPETRESPATGDLPKLGRYELIEKIGRGGMGVVYRAMDPAIGRVVAIKTILPKDAEGEDSQLRARLVRESQAVGRLSHPNIVAVHDVGEEGQTSYIVMEYVDGRTLDQILREDPARLSNPEIVRIIEECAGALDYAHGRGVVHRDIKPANVMLQRDGTVKIADFGIAMVSQASALTQKSMTMGSPNYMAPEQWRGERATGQADQYALAALAYTVLAGRRPFEEDTLAGLAAKVLYQNPPAALSFNPRLNPMVDVVLRKALSKKAERRYPTCAGFARELRGAVDGTQAPPSAATRKWWMVASASALIAVLSAAGWFYYADHLRREATPARIDQAPSPAKTLPPESKVAQVPPSTLVPPSKGSTSPGGSSSPGNNSSQASGAAGQSDSEPLAEAFLKQHDYAQAIRYFTLAIATKPSYRAYYGRASAHRLLNQMENAVADYGQAILLDPNSASAYHNRAVCEMRLGLEKNAADDYDQALKLDPTNPRTWNDRGAIYLKNGGYHKAEDCFSRAIELDNGFAVAYRNRGQAEKK
jgi:serine/threonine protein kinase